VRIRKLISTFKKNQQWGCSVSRLFKKRGQKAGLPPGSLVYIGEKRTRRVTITIIDYDESRVEEKEVELVEDFSL